MFLNDPVLSYKSKRVRIQMTKDNVSIFHRFVFLITVVRQIHEIQLKTRWLAVLTDAWLYNMYCICMCPLRNSGTNP